jgi:hypothetical protein
VRPGVQQPRILLRPADGGPVNGWRPDGTGIVSHGDCGGDIQVGDSYSVRFRHPRLPNAVITRSAYAANDTDRNPGEYFVQVLTEWLVCTDPERPGDTETWSDASHDDWDGTWASAAEAEADARDRVASELLSNAYCLDWDGQPFP